jgi:spermidine/putrescine-binding protein
VTVLILLLLINRTPNPKKKKEKKPPVVIPFIRRFLRKPYAKFALAGLLLVCAAGGIFAGLSRMGATSSNQVIVYNWGEYIDPDVLDLFEEETGIKVIYDEFETNEIMYPKVEAGTSAYDVICPSDYMIEKMIQNDLLLELDYDNIPNAVNIGEQYYEKAQEFDPENKYSIPYCWGTVGILYNKTMVDEPVDSWSILWDEKYKNNILMQDSVRDAFMVSLKLNGFSMNTTDLSELEIARDSLIAQQPLVQAYVVDQVRDKMIGGEAALGVIYSGEAIYTQKENPDLEYVIPKEGTNVWIDAWVIPKTAQNKENAEAFINFMCRADIALMNFEYITYSTPNEAARELIEDEDIRESEIAFPDLDQYDNLETYLYIGEDGDELYNTLWKEVKSN